MIKIINLNDPNAGEQLREAIGLEPGEKLEVYQPQFDRIDGQSVPPIPADLSALPKMTENELRLLGCQRWDENHWLYPGEWYDSIPEGHPMLCIDGSTVIFEKGKTDNDTRFGALAYGFLRIPEGSGGTDSQT